jgi:MFS family permease
MNTGLVRYLVAATLVRGADAGAVVGLVLLAIDPDRRERAGPAIGGLLAAALSAPHLLGPWIAHRLDRVRDGRGLLAASYLGYGVALAIGTLTVGRAPAAVAIVAVAVAGACGPLLTGGLSSRLAGIVGPGEREQRRAQGWDAMTYGLGGTVGPAVVAGLSSVTGPQTALLGLALAAAVGAALTVTLPAAPPGASPPEQPVTSVGSGLALLVTSGPLRRVTTLTMLNALGAGTLPLAAVALGLTLAGRAGAGATLTTAVGIGSLAGSLLVTAVPLRGDPDRRARELFAALVVVTVGCALASTFALALVGFAAIGAAQAIAFTATLAARSAYAPASARAQVFITSAGLKVAMQSAGAALAGVGIGAGLGGRSLLLAAAALAGAGVLVAAMDAVRETRRAARRSPRRSPASADPRCAD